MTDSELVARFEEAAVANHSREEVLAARKDLEAVVTAGITTIDQLSDAAADSTMALHVRSIACWLLAWLGVKTSTAALERAFRESEDDGVMWEAAKALARLEATTSAPALVAALENGRPAKQSAAAWVLGWFRLPETIPPVWKAALNPAMEESARGHAIEALGVMGAHDAVPDLIALLRNGSPELRYWAAYALGEIGDESCIPALQEMARDDDVVLSGGRSLRDEAADALECIRAARRDRS